MIEVMCDGFDWYVRFEWNGRMYTANLSSYSDGYWFGPEYDADYRYGFASKRSAVRAAKRYLRHRRREQARMDRLTKRADEWQKKNKTDGWIKV